MSDSPTLVAKTSFVAWVCKCSESLSVPLLEPSCLADGAPARMAVIRTMMGEIARKLERIQGHRNTCALLLGMDGKWKTVWRFFKVKHQITTGPSHSTPKSVPPKLESRDSNKYL